MYTATGNSFPAAPLTPPTPYNPFSKLEALNPNLAERIRNLINYLEKQKAQDSAKRLSVVAQQFHDFTVEGAYQYIKKDEIILELEEKGTLWLSVLNAIRDALSIAPIAFTWGALHLAATAYQKDLTDKSVSAKDLYQPFLLLWEESFHGNHGWIIPFSTAAIWDAALLTLLILMFVFIVPWAKGFHRARIYKSLCNIDGVIDFDSVIDDLLALIGRKGANTLLQDRDTKKIAEIIKQVLADVLLNYDRVASESRDYIRETKEQTETLVGAFHRDLAFFNKDILLLTNDLQKMSTNLGTHDQQVQALTHASNRLADSSNELASSADLNAKASQGIGNRLNDLNTTQQEIVKTQQQVADTIQQTQAGMAQTLVTNQQIVYQEIAKTQQQVVQEVTTAQHDVVQKIVDSQKEIFNEMTVAADVVTHLGKDTRDVSLNLEEVAAKLEQLTRTDFKVMTDSVNDSNQDLVREMKKTIDEIMRAADEVKRVATNLSQFDKPAKALSDAADRVSNAAAGLPQLQQPSQKLSEAAESLEKAVSSLVATARPWWKLW